jgi:two-component system chemotaxis response regulator CheB
VSKLITAKTHSKFYAEIQHGVFIAAINKSGPGFAVYIEDPTIPQDTADALSLFHQELLTGEYEVKLLANANTDSINENFKTKKITVAKEILITEKFEVIFTLENSSIKMAKKSDSAPAPVNSNSEASDSPLVAIGSSTGGVEALMQIFANFPSQIPPIVVAQHIPADFSRTLCERFNKMFKFEVKEACDGDEIKPNRILIAPGGKHLRVKKTSSGKLIASIGEDSAINRHRPSVDVLFQSVAECIGANAVGVILTGMGDDGAKGLLEMKGKGAYTIAQNKETCVVFGMPRVAIELGAANKVLPLSEIAAEILKSSSKLKAA